MNATERKAIAEVLESYFEPDSPEALAFAMYQLRRIYQAASGAGRGRGIRLGPPPKITLAMSTEVQ